MTQARKEEARELWALNSRLSEAGPVTAIDSGGFRAVPYIRV